MSVPTGAVITGAGRGIGKLLAQLLVERGYTVLITDVDEAAARAAAEELGSDVLWARLDVRDEIQVRAARDLIVDQVGQLAVWINNAGVLVTGPAWEQQADTHRLMLEVNALGTIHGTVAAIEAMRQDGGHIVNIISLAGLSSVPGEAVYAASKHAALGFSLSTLADLKIAGIENIDVSCICPDGIWTPMLYDKLDDPASALSFSGKLLAPAEVVAAVATVLDRPRPVTAVPGWRGAQARLADAFPGFSLRVLPLVAAHGRRVQRKLRETGVPAHLGGTHRPRSRKP